MISMFLYGLPNKSERVAAPFSIPYSTDHAWFQLNDHPEVTLHTWWDVKTQELTSRFINQKSKRFKQIADNTHRLPDDTDADCLMIQTQSAWWYRHRLPVVTDTDCLTEEGSAVISVLFFTNWTLNWPKNSWASFFFSLFVLHSIHMNRPREASFAWIPFKDSGVNSLATWSFSTTLCHSTINSSSET